MKKIAFILLIFFLGCKENTKEKEPAPAPDEHKAVMPKLTDLKGQPIDLETLKGKTVFLNFWATWCKPCIKEMPTIKNAQAILKNHKIVFLLASGESVEEINEFKKSNDPDLNFVRLTNLEELNFDGLPTTYIYDPKGKLVFSETGFRQWDDSSNLDLIKKINHQ